MNGEHRHRRRWAGALLLALLFFAASAYHIERPGLQADEALFAQGVWETGVVETFTRVFGWRVPLMQMPYLGALKAILYQPIFALFGASAATVRLPMALAGAATVALTFLLLWKLRGETAAWLGGALLACDPTFLFTTRCDWGPVAIERLLAVGGVLLFTQGRLGPGALLFGLALWNKTTFAWTLLGLSAGMLLCYRPQLRVRPVALAAMLGCFALGAYPWIRYNVRSRGGTMEATARFDASDLPGKTRLLGRSLEGSALYGYMMRESGDAGPWPRANVTPWLLLAAVGVALARRDRLALFFTIAAAVTWLAMAFTKDGGASTHHAVLLWPWPHCLIALSASHWRACTVAVALGALLSAGVVMRHYTLIDRYGADPPWSDAIYPLAKRVKAASPQGVFVTDWGVREPLMLFTQGRLPFEVAFHRHLPPEHFAARVGWMFAGHVDERQAIQGVNAPWKQVAGFRRVTLARVADAQGFPIFELFRFEPAADAPNQTVPRP